MLKILGKYNIKIFLMYTEKIFYICFQKMMKKGFHGSALLYTVINWEQLFICSK